MKTTPAFLLLLTCLLTLGATQYAAGQISRKGNTQFKVVINHEEQYSIVPAARENPLGWNDTKVNGSLEQCREYIEEVWTDMRPLSVRKMDLPANTRYVVIINHEEQYSLWPEKKTPPKGWKPTGKTGDLVTCMDYIEEVWTDMRPKSMRKGMK